MTKKEILGLATTLWGEINQRNQLQEELTELDLAICKLRRRGDEDKKMDNFFEEIADVKIMIDQMEHIYGTKEINSHYEKKLNRLGGRVQESLEKVPCYNEITELYKEATIKKYFNKVISPNLIYLKSKDGEFDLFVSLTVGGFDLMPVTNNINNKFVKKYLEEIPTAMALSKENMIKVIEELFS